MRVILADDAVLFREGTARILAEAGFEVIGQAGDAVDCSTSCAAIRPTWRSSTSACRPVTPPKASTPPPRSDGPTSTSASCCSPNTSRPTRPCG